MKYTYKGITYFSFLDNKFILKIWKKLFCKIGIHLFDEVISDKHYLICDACDLRLIIEEEKT